MRAVNRLWEISLSYWKRSRIAWLSVNVYIIRVLLAGIFITVTPSYVLGQRYYYVDDNIAGELFCRLIGSTYFLFVFGKGSTLTIMCLAIERWFSVVKPVKYKYAFKRGRLLLYIAIIWAFSCFTQINELFIMKNSHGICARSSPPYSVKTEKILTLLHILATFFVPSIVTWVTFAHVWFHVRSTMVHHRTRLSNYERAKQKLIRMCALTALLLTVCWFPAEMFFILKEFNVVTLSLSFYQFTDMLAMSNSCFNPWVYFIYNREYRKAFLSLVTVKMRKQDNRTTAFTLLSTAKSPSVVLIRQVNMQPELGSREINVYLWHVKQYTKTMLHRDQPPFLGIPVVVPEDFLSLIVPLEIVQALQELSGH